MFNFLFPIKTIKILIFYFSFLIGIFSLADSSASTEPISLELFHAGRKDILMKDINAHGVPQEDWDKFIMGGTTTWDLPKWRRGLYGAENMGLTLSFGLKHIKRGLKNWMMIIKLKPECTAPERVNFLTYFYIHDSSFESSFTKWYQKNMSRYQDKVDLCVTKGEYDGKKIPELDRWNPGSPFLISDHSPEEQKLSALCSPVIDDYLNENKFVLSIDEYVDGNDMGGSWYIRDRNCIEDIVGTADDWFQRIFIEKNYGKEILGDPLYGHSYTFGEHPEVVNIFMMQILSESQLLKTKYSDLISWLLSFKQEKAYALGPNSNGSYKDIYNLIDMAIECTKNKKVEFYQQQVQKSVDFMVKQIGEMTKKVDTISAIENEQERRSTFANAESKFNKLMDLNKKKLYTDLAKKCH